MTKQVTERELVLAILMEVTQQNVYSHLALNAVLEKYQYLEKKERAFITRVTEGTLEHMIELDYILNQFSKVKVNKMKPVIRNILRSAVYQLKYMDVGCLLRMPWTHFRASCRIRLLPEMYQGFGWH